MRARLIGVKPASTANSARKPVVAEEDHADAHVANLLAELDGLDFGGSDSGSSGGGAGGGDDAEVRGVAFVCLGGGVIWRLCLQDEVGIWGKPFSPLFHTV